VPEQDEFRAPRAADLNLDSLVSTTGGNTTGAPGSIEICNASG